MRSNYLKAFEVLSVGLDRMAASKVTICISHFIRESLLRKCLRALKSARVHDPLEILASKGDLFLADYISAGHTTFRMEAMKHVSFDSAYKMGYEHLDLFMQFQRTRWKYAVHKKSIFINLYYKSPKDYRTERFRESLLEASRRHFIEKWGYQPIAPKVTKKEVLSKLLKGLVNKLVLAIYARVLFNYPFI